MNLRRFLRNKYYGLPVNIRLILINLYYIVKPDKILNAPCTFPLNLIKKLEYPIFGKSVNEGYFFRFYQELEKRITSVNELSEKKYEIIKGQYISNKTHSAHCTEEVALPISIEKSTSNFKFIYNNNTHDLKYLAPKRFHYFKLNKGSAYQIESDVGTVVGDPIPIKQKIKHDKKLVLCIFIDGLADLTEIDGADYEKLMPNTMEFFREGVKFNNHFANADWTLPSVPSFFTGKHVQGSRFFDPSANHIIGENSLILSEIFKNDGYMTFQSGGNYRVTPGYGYVKGFDRTIYKRGLDVVDVIHTFLENLRTFNERDNFSWLSIFDIHHVLKTVPDINNQLRNSIASHSLDYDNPNKKKKSVFASKDSDKTEVYLNEITRVDFYLNIIYEYINKNYNSEEIVVTLLTDHGQAFLTSDNYPLSIARTKIPWMIRGGGISKKDANELTENIDIFSSLLKCCKIKSTDEICDSNIPVSLGGKTEKKFVLSQSIHPGGQTYKAVIRDYECEYRFDGSELVSANGTINGKIILKSIDNLNSNKNKVICNKKSKHYEKIITAKVKEWNIGL